MANPDFTLIASRGDFHDALRGAFGEAANLGCREIWISDPDFADWPLGEPEVIEHLRRWAHPHRKLTVLAQTFDHLARRHPRWVEWRRDWSHVVECRVIDELEVGQMPTVMVASGLLSLRLTDPVHYRGSVSRDVGSLVRCRESIDAILQRSTVAFPATILGI